MLRHAETHCPFCRAIIDAVSEVNNEPVTPDDGDISLCWNCGEWMVFTAAAPGGLRRPTHEEYEEITDEPRFGAIRRAWLMTTKETH
jgi:hypothetical protein